MSLQDDFFDVESALEGKPEAEQFDRIWARLCQLEKFQEQAVRAFAAMEHGQFWQQQILRGDWRDWLK